MRLSEVGRLGAMLKPQARNGFDTDGSCFLRAAADALGIRDFAGQLNYGALQQRFPILLEKATHPIYGWTATVAGVIFSLNDSCGKSREWIADWLEPIELAHEPQAEPVAVEVAL